MADFDTTPVASTDAIANTPLETAGGGQFQSDWANTPEGQDYLSKHDEREAAYEAEAKFLANSAASQDVAPVNESFTEAPDTTPTAPVEGTDVYVGAHVADTVIVEPVAPVDAPVDVPVEELPVEPETTQQ